MSQPVIADNKPRKVELEKGKAYDFCVCGRSRNQPFCDGSHRGTGFTPQRFVAEEDGAAFLCRCKHTGNAPFCDGTHKKFGQEQVGKEGPGRS
ncbi:CDGSH iron-sulfur domain-containing protein [Halomonas salifodinae]|uniref:CDGSH iron-sulfur domain-containing protein n=1 Tax=Halomonas salifodinae TaxID=438745 RepID=A0ABW2F3S2_9GAMM